jgi:hypothetical protein
MQLITTKGTIDSESEVIIMTFDDDDEFNSFMSRLAATPVKTSGMRILTIVPDGVEMSPVQLAILDVINGLDGAFSKDKEEHDKIIDGSVDGLNKIIEDFG